MATPFSNLLSASGLALATRDEIIAYLTAQYQAIYGSDIDLSSSSPDGQMMGIQTQIILDLQDLLLGIYNSKSPATAVGTGLDQVVEINGIQRQAGTYTITPLSVTVDRPLTLYGLDQTAEEVLTYSDNAGNKWQLQTTQAPSGAGTEVYNFQAANPGRVFTTINTITVPVTIVLGVTAVNNPSAYTTLGIDEESDGALRIRQQKAAVAQKMGYYDKLYTDLFNIPGMSDVFIHENKGDSVDSVGAVPHSLWVVVAGSAAAASIAQAIYANRGAGCNMNGVVYQIITQADGTTFTVLWDAVTTEPLYIKFTATPIDGVTPPNYEQILSGLPELMLPGVNQVQNANDVATYVRQIDPNTLVTNAGVNTSPSDPFFQTIANTGITKQFSLTSDQIYILPVLLLPNGGNVTHEATQQFTAYGGSQLGYVYSILVDNSGCSIDASTGLYTAGTTPNVVDTVKVEDGDGNTAVATVNVT